MTFKLITTIAGMDDPAIKMAHESALRSIARVVHETTEHTPPRQALARVVDQLRAGGVLFVTGAGVSTDSGIPDYRGANGSLTRHRPMTYQEFKHDPAALHRYWARSFVGWRHMDEASPNSIHRAIASFESAGHVMGVITQNVDGLHQQAGSKNVLAIHGDLATVVCLDCGHHLDRRKFDELIEAVNPGYVESIELDPAQVNPDGDVTLHDHQIQGFQLAGCPVCGSLRMKPNVVYFGEPVPAESKQRMVRMLDQSRSVIVAGSSLAVMSGMRIVIDAKKQGKQVSVINGGPGRADSRVDTLWRTDLATAMAAIHKELSAQ
jgi:NAD-dependent SIR2 family protein deacetylase